MSQATALADARELRTIMNRWGVPCSIELVPGRGSDPWATPTKYHRMHHHTVSTYILGGRLTPVLALCKTGRVDVPGPLCNGYGGFDLVYRIICMGLANHPGVGGPITIDGVHIPKDSARGPTWGTEWEGGLQNYEMIPGMLEFMGLADNALAEWTRRPVTSQMEHKTWAPARKVDRRGFTRDRGIALTRQFAGGGTPPPPPKPVEVPDMYIAECEGQTTIVVGPYGGQEINDRQRRALGMLGVPVKTIDNDARVNLLSLGQPRSASQAVNNVLVFEDAQGQGPLHDIVRRVTAPTV